MEAVALGELDGQNGVAGLVVGGVLLILLRDHPALLLGPHLDPGDGLLQIRLGDPLPVGPGGQDGGLVEHVL